MELGSSNGAIMRVTRRWRPSDCSSERAMVAVALNLAPLVVALACFALVAPPSDWSDPVVVLALGAVSAIAYFAEARLELANRVFFGASLGVALVALAVAGPGPALLVWLVPDLLARFVLRSEARLSPGFAANVGSYAIAVLVGAYLLELSGSPTGLESAAAVYTAGVAMWASNWIVARLAFAPFYQGAPAKRIVREEFAASAPASLAMLVLAVAAALSVEALGVWALLALTATILIPQLVFERLLISESAATLDPTAATRLYAEAIADVMELPRIQRREIACAAGFIDAEAGREQQGLEWRHTDVSRAAFLALHSHERWAGNGWPAGLPAEAIPIGSRILAVALEWSSLTARGTAQLSQADALLALEAQSGHAFDPNVVTAAVQVVEDEAGFSVEPCFQPKLHRLPGPRAWRRGALPGLLPGPAAG